jgi:hypothetical protein
MPPLKTTTAKPEPTKPAVDKSADTRSPTPQLPAAERPATITFQGQTYICALADIMPARSPENEVAFRKDLETTKKVTYPVVVTEHNEILDGASRLRLAVELGITDVEFQVVRGLTEEQKRYKVLTLNLLRRHLDREQMRELIGKVLRWDPKQGDNLIADMVGVSHATVGAGNAAEVLRSAADRRVDRTHARLLASAKALATVRRIVRPGLSAVEMAMAVVPESRPGVTNRVKAHAVAAAN